MNGFLLFIVMVCQTGGYPAESGGVKCVTNHEEWIKVSDIKTLWPEGYVLCKDTDYETDESKREENGPNRMLNCEKNGWHEGCYVNLIDGDHLYSSKPCSLSLMNRVNEFEIR